MKRFANWLGEVVDLAEDKREAFVWGVGAAIIFMTLVIAIVGI